MQFTASRIRMGEKGLTLIEVLVAFAVVSVAFAGIMALMGRALAASSVIRQDLIAANLAQEGIELVRSMRDANWIVGNTDDGKGKGGGCRDGSWRADLCDNSRNDPYRVDAINEGLLPNEPTALLRRRDDGMYCYDCDGTSTSFRREVELSTPQNDPATPFNDSDVSMTVRSTVRWCSGGPVASCPGRERSLTVEDALYNWLPQ